MLVAVAEEAGAQLSCGDALRLCVISANVAVLLWRQKTLAENLWEMKSISIEKYPPDMKL